MFSIVTAFNLITRYPFNLCLLVFLTFFLFLRIFYAFVRFFLFQSFLCCFMSFYCIYSFSYNLLFQPLTSFINVSSHFLIQIIHVPYSNLYSYFWFTYSFFKNSFVERIFTSLFHEFFHRSAFLRSYFKIKTRLFATWWAGIGISGWALIGNMGGRQLELYIGIYGGGR